MKNFLLVALALLVAAPGRTLSHEVVHNVTRGSAVVVEISHENGSPFSHEEYEVRLKGEDAPFQTGRTDALGRIVFVPDRQGSWRIRAFSEDGHGVDMTIDSGPEDAPGTVSSARESRGSKIVFGVVMILLAFMIVLAIVRRRAA